jgi:hypothetical protein
MALRMIPNGVVRSDLLLHATYLRLTSQLFFASAQFPNILKNCMITPVLKNHIEDPCTLSNYRPVTNLSLVSKTLEKPLTEHFEKNSVFDNYQSGYRNHHSTETALIKVVDDMASEMDEGKVILLVALDVLVAIDAVQHEILLKRLMEAGMQVVCFKGQKFNSRSIKYGVPQGSVMGPFLFNLYMAPVAVKDCTHYHVVHLAVKLHSLLCCS